MRNAAREDRPFAFSPFFWFCLPLLVSWVLVVAYDVLLAWPTPVLWRVLWTEPHFAALVGVEWVVLLLILAVVWRFRERLSHYRAMQIWLATFSAYWVATMVSFDAFGHLDVLAANLKEPRRTYWALLFIPLCFLQVWLNRYPRTPRRGIAKQTSTAVQPPAPPRPLYRRLLEHGLEMLFGLAIVSGVGGLLIGIPELVGWLLGPNKNPLLQLYSVGFLFFFYLLLLPLMGQMAIAREDFTRKHHSAFWLTCGMYLGSLISCVLIFTYHSQQLFLADEGQFRNASPDYLSWLLYCLNSLLDGILFGAPSIFEFEITPIAPALFYPRLTLFLFRLTCVAGLIQTARILGKLFLGWKVSADDLSPLARGMAED